MTDHITDLAIMDEIFGLVTNIDLTTWNHLEQTVFRSKQEQIEF